jgi:aryl-alcohol dehydrogenase-like predicted oxidoreductase
MESRRHFIRKMTGITTGLMLPWGATMCTTSVSRDKFGELLPLRKLGTTGEKVTMLGVGGYHVGWTSERDAQEVIETAIEQGIRFFDTAHNYGRGTSEERYGKYLIPNYRDHIFLMTKSQAGNHDELLKEFQLSLDRMKTESVDLLQIHSLRTPEDVDQRIDAGVLDAMMEIKESGRARYIGFTGHQNPYAHARMIEALGTDHAFSTLQMPISIVDYASDHSFVKHVIPRALDSGLGLLAMKTLADGRYFAKKQQLERVRWETDQPVIPNYISVKDALFFSWTMPIGTLITGAENKDLLIEKVDLAKQFAELSEDNRLALLDKVTEAPDLENVEYYKNVEG